MSDIRVTIVLLFCLGASGLVEGGRFSPPHDEKPPTSQITMQQIDRLYVLIQPVVQTSISIHNALQANVVMINITIWKTDFSTDHRQDYHYWEKSISGQNIINIKVRTLNQDLANFCEETRGKEKTTIPSFDMENVEIDPDVDCFFNVDGKMTATIHPKNGTSIGTVSALIFFFFAILGSILIARLLTCHRNRIRDTILTPHNTPRT